ncbi:hypothetical protein AC251_01240 [Ralstonia pseudosolanacearum]|uniref:Uncharacterized protein n=1 Tax=Ralstonia pseudosolanacearum TaxID=1310165 RepID=A0A454TI22_9RALS|nr:hypothetical protein AC251_01240 [Ralstonia pseudosolanacearum]NKA09870.1 hypothetical protein [Ralstonia solanacearum]RNL98614.1 hypothetical protein EGA29_26470 [Ralstonia pseudosolanacearum]
MHTLFRFVQGILSGEQIACLSKLMQQVDSWPGRLFQMAHGREQHQDSKRPSDSQIQSSDPIRHKKVIVRGKFRAFTTPPS